MANDDLLLQIDLDTAKAKRAASVLAGELQKTFSAVTLGGGVATAAGLAFGTRDPGAVLQQAGGFGIEKLVDAITASFGPLGAILGTALKTGAKEALQQVGEPLTRATGRVGAIAGAAAAAGVPIDPEILAQAVARAIAQENARQAAERAVNRAAVQAIGESGVRAVFGGAAGF